jgi:hypothetical protein
MKEEILYRFTQYACLACYAALTLCGLVHIPYAIRQESLPGTAVGIAFLLSGIILFRFGRKEMKSINNRHPEPDSGIN